MKSLRISALMLAVGAFSIGSNPAHAQQEVDPDHFDQPSVLSTHVQSSRVQNHHSAAAAQHLTKSTIADAGTIKPPIIVVSPSAPKKPTPVAHQSVSTIADAGNSQSPIVILVPIDPKKTRPVAHESAGTIADAGTVKPPIIVVGPSAPNKPVPVAHEAIA